TGSEVIEPVFDDPQPSGIAGVTTPSKAACRKAIEQAFVGQRLHRQRLLENPRTTLQIGERVVHRYAAGRIRDAPAKLDRLLYPVASALNSFRSILGRRLRGDRQTVCGLAGPLCQGA